VPGWLREEAFWSNFFDAVTVSMLRRLLRRPEAAAWTPQVLHALAQVRDAVRVSECSCPCDQTSWWSQNTAVPCLGAPSWAC
jgi:hypothetical protein